jgi:hypothetical protein
MFNNNQSYYFGLYFIIEIYLPEETQNYSLGGYQKYGNQ